MSFDIMIKAKSIGGGDLESFGNKGRKVTITFDEAGDEYVSGLVRKYETTPSDQIEGLTWTFTPSPKQNPLSLG